MIISCLLAFAIAGYASGYDGCLYDGRIYQTGEVAVIRTCLGEMTCLGHDNFSPIRPATNCQVKRSADGQSGCLFDGRVYEAGQVIMIGKCLAQMTCLGNNNYGELIQLGGICPSP